MDVDYDELLRAGVRSWWPRRRPGMTDDEWLTLLERRTRDRELTAGTWYDRAGGQYRPHPK